MRNLSKKSLKIKQIVQPYKMKIDELNIKTSNLCNYKCPKCFDNNNPDKKISSLEPKRLEELITYLQQNCGLKRVCLSGGEPLLYPHIWRIHDFAINSGLKIVTQTNGALIKKYSKDLVTRTNDNFKLAVSLDTLIPEVYDKITNTKNQLPQVLNGMKTLISKGFKNLYIMSIINKNSINQLLSIYEFVKENNLKGVTYQPYSPFYFLVTKLGINYIVDSSFNENWVTKEQMSLLSSQLKKLANIKKQGGKLIQNTAKEFDLYKKYFEDPYSLTFKCDNFNILMITQKGEIKTCWSSSYKLGNIYNEEFGSIFKKYPLSSKIMASCEQPCLLKCHKVKVKK